MSRERFVVSGEIDLVRVRGLLFDVDGTLSDTDDAYVDRISRLLKPAARLFRDRNPNKFARWLVMAIESPANFFYNLSDRLGLDRSFLRVYTWLSQRFRTEKPNHNRFRLIPGTREMLAVLSRHYPLAVVSARDAQSTRHFLEFFNLTQYFEVIVTAQTCRYTKPFADPVLWAAEQLGLAPEACVMIGDTIVDIQAGKAANAQTIGVLCGFGVERELKRAGADLILLRTPDILEVFLMSETSTEDV